MNLKKTLIICLAMLIIGYTAGQKVSAKSKEPGSIDDPIVTKSYVDQLIKEKVENLEAEIDDLKDRIKKLEGKVGEYTPTKSKEIVLQIDVLRASINGDLVALETAPYLQNNVTMLPFSFIGKELGAKVEWIGSTKTVVFTSNNKVIELKINSTTAILNGQEVALASPAVIRESKTFVPLRFVADHLGAKVNWEKATKTITITT